MPRSPRQCAAKEDFQSTELELYQNKFIETPGIEALRIAGSLSQSEFEQVSMWMALHILRSPTARAELFESKEDYEKRLLSELQIERLFCDYYRFAYTHLVPQPNFVITSDSPVIEFTCANFLIGACAISPQKLIFFSPQSGKFEHELSTHDFFNAMMFGGPAEYLYSHRSDVSVDKLAQFARAYELQAVIEDMRFTALSR
jgi:hypothetical protein